MAESNATQVILTDDGLKIIKAQSTADNAANGVTNLNDPNLMSVIEKQNNIGQFAGLTSQFNVIVQNAKDDGIDTTAITTAYNNLNRFMADILADPDHASDIDRVTYKKYQNAYNEELTKLQNALQNNANNKFTSAASATSQAASTASQAFSQAQAVNSQADSAIAVQSTATAKAQSTADSAFSQAVTAIDTGQATSQAVTALKDGSTLTIAELGSGLATKVSNSEFGSFKYQTASQIGELVTDGAFSAYSQSTAKLISATVATSDFASYKDETAKAIDSKVASSAFATYKDQTATAISSKVDNGDFTTYKTQTANNIDLKVTKKGLFDEINLQAGHTLISSSGQLTLSGKTICFDTANPVIIPSANIDTLLVDKKLTAADISANTFTTNNETFKVESNGAITAKNMTLTGGTLYTPTINTSTINGSTINGTTFNAGDSISNSNNTSNFYPFTIEPTGKASTTLFNSVDALRTEMSGGGLRTMYRAINSSGSQYEAYDGNFSGDMISLNSGFTNGKDMSFSQSVSGSQLTGQVLISPLNGLTLHGDTQQITFNGTSDDVTPKGVIITPYGNINPNGTQNIWYVGNNMNMKTAQFGIDANNEFGVDLFRPTFVDEIGAMGNRLPNGRLFLHATDNNAQMYLLNDGSPAFVSPTIYNRTYSNGANMFVTSSGRVGRTTSASKYKLAITRSDDTLQADRLMTLNLASWNDKVATEKMAESLSNGETPAEAEINLKRHYGLIAEDLRDAGLDEFLITGKDGQIEGIEYDRLWTVLIPKIKQLNNRINELERKTL
ncbi:hypothetical protein [Lactiplantibacillus plantarum]|uniref:hypothetical protein n=1 Tax=Lactiplantibacillus plantarum TaxID=1590 RepID=UPI003F534EF4